MAFKYRRNGLNHSPDWYASRRTGEPRGGVLIGALKRDMATLGGEPYDPKMEWTENIDRYREYFEAARKGEILDGKRYDQTANLCYDVIEREALEGYRPEDLFKDEPFSTISELMLKHGINAETMRHFLKWRSRQVGIQKREKAIEDKRKAEYKKSAELLRRIKGGKPTPKFFDYEVEQEPPGVEPEPPELP